MAFDTLAALRLSLTAELDVGSQIADSKLDDKIKLAENKVHKKLRVREMETALTATVNSSGTVSVPSDYLDMKYAYMNTSPIRKLQRKNAEWIYERYPDRSAGTEQYFAREASNFIFGPAGTENRVMKGIYYGKPTAMTSTINSVFSAYPECYFYAALSECETFLGRDARLAVWEAKMEKAISDANQQSRDEELSGSDASTTPG